MRNFRGIKVLFLGILTIILIMTSTAKQVNASPTELSIVPASLTVGTPDQPLPTEPFTINITLTNFEDVYLWQIRIVFNPQILNCTGAWYPEDHIFAGKMTAPTEPVIDNTAGYVLWGNSLVGEVPGVSGTRATLCQINFTGVAEGISTITFQLTGTGRTFLWNSELNFIEFTANPGEVTVVPEYPNLLILTVFLITSVGLVLHKKFATKTSNKF
ncbi:MAG: hypothetical protein QW791_03270 [Candidatus Bathyarchaeia archaeon]